MDDDSNPSNLFLGDESYQGPPASGFEDSKGMGVTSFKQGASLDSAGPSDFGFLMKRFSKGYSNADAMVDDVDTGAASHKRVRVGTVDNGNSEERTDGLTILPPPCPPMRPHQVPFGVVEGEDRGSKAMNPAVFRTDPYFWMRDYSHEDPEVQKLLKDEDAYCSQTLSRLQNLRERLYAEMIETTKETDVEVPAPDMDGFAYYNRSFQGKAYKAHYRARIVSGMGCKHSGGAGVPVPGDVLALAPLVGVELADEQLLMDENILADSLNTDLDEDDDEKPYFSVKGPALSADSQLYSYAVDLKGNDNYSIRFRKLGGPDSGHDVGETLENTEGSVEWVASGHGALYYMGLDSEFRAGTVRHHVSGTPQSEDRVLLDEVDRTFSVSIKKTHDLKVLLVATCAADTSEYHLLDLQSGASGMLCVSKRQHGHRYEVDHHDGFIYILTNKDGFKDMKLCRVSIGQLQNGDGPEKWQDIWTPEPGTKLDSLQCFDQFLALVGREGSVRRIFVLHYHQMVADGKPSIRTVLFPEARPHNGVLLTPRTRTAAITLYSVGFHTMRMFSTDTLRLYRADYCCPSRIYSYHVPTDTFKLLKQEGTTSFDSSRYRAERITSQRRKVPISLVYRADIHSEGLRGGPYPTLYTGYGAYGACLDPDFDSTLLTLLDRGVVIATAHVRGGGELGEEWTLEGRQLNYKNRFWDFEAAAETLLELGISEKGRIVGWGESSGGCTVSATANMRPDLFKALLLEVPFVDCLNTMSDPTIPLTCTDWAESGNTNERDFFHLVMEYAPYENIRMQPYPATLCTAALNDTMVGYWEPLKYVAKLRKLKMDDNPVLLKVNFNAGHSHHSDRYQCMKERAFTFAFVLDQLGIRT